MTEPTNYLMPPQTVSRAGETVDAMVGVKQYAELNNAGERTVRTWLADGRLHSARKLNGVWMIAPDDKPASEPWPAAGGLVAVPKAAQPLPQVPAGLVAELEYAPAFLELELAAHLLGISESAIRRNRDYFELKPFGAHGALVMPAGRVRAIAGLS